MHKITFKQAGLAASIFVLGWAAAVSYMSWQYDFNFSPWQKDEISVLPLTQAVFKRQCIAVTEPELRKVAQGEKGVFLSAWLGWMEGRFEALTRRLSLSAASFSYTSCIVKADNEGRPYDECKKALEERILMHRVLKELPAK